MGSPSSFIPCRDSTLNEKKSFLQNTLGSPSQQTTNSLVAMSGSIIRDGFGFLLSAMTDSGIADATHPSILIAKNRVCEPWTQSTQAWVSSPLFRSWLHKFVYNLSSTSVLTQAEIFISEIPNYCLDIKSIDFAKTALLSRGGVIELYDTRYAIKWPRDGLVELIIDEDIIRFKSGRENRMTLKRVMINDRIRLVGIDASEGCKLLEAPSLPYSSSIVVRNDLNSLRVKLDTSKTPERCKTYKSGETDKSSYTYPSTCVSLYKRPCGLLAGSWLNEFLDWDTTLHVVVPYRPPSGWIVGGFTISSLQGACWISNGTSTQILESLIHEQSHVKLRYLEECVPILKLEQTTDLFNVGWRTDPRPIAGLYEGIYVNIHVLEAFSRLLESSLLDPDEYSDILRRGRELYLQVHEACKIIIEHGNFTDPGQAYKDWSVCALERFIAIFE